MNLFSPETKALLSRGFSDYGFCFHDILESTQSECLSMYQKSHEKKWVILANEQTQGRGRYARTWQSPPGVNLYVSLVDDNFFGKEIGYLNLFYGILLFEAVSSVLGSHRNQLTLKWPNDLYFYDKKLAGILLQSLEEGMQKLILGIGINVYAQREQIPQIGTSLLLENPDLEANARISILEKLLSSLQKEHRQEYLHNPKLLLNRFWEYSAGTQKRNYLYSCHFYSHTGVLDKIHPDGTIDILTQDAQRIHLTT
ncbi:MAG: biotin--[acetyl-CoA-carboxylase] ligase [Candidatus Brocadiae bacterium]|nr:biotin--[acetyl-CoA-carboxylase] ligase [Candidatus Brocadiia bacterium]